jgi:undecaprenyl-diphosphatase
VNRTLIGPALRLWAAVSADRKLFRLTALGLAVVSASGMLIAKLLDDVMGADGVTGADRTITDWVVQHRAAGMTTAAQAVTHLGDPLVVVGLALVTAAVLLVRRERRLAILVAVSTSGAAVATTVTKYAVHRARPNPAFWLGAASGPAFPSGHATQSVALYGALAIVGVRLARSMSARVSIIGLATLIALAVGTTRVYLAVHWTSDVLCGWAVAVGWLSALLLGGWSRPRAALALRNHPTPTPPSVHGRRPTHAGSVDFARPRAHVANRSTA